MRATKREYWLVLHDDEGPHGVAEGGDELADELSEELGAQSWLREWEPPRLELVEGEPSDYLVTDQPLRLCSMRLRGLIDVFRGPDDRWQWLPVTIFRGEETWDYQALHLLRATNWLDAGHSRYADGQLVKPVVNRELAGERRVLAPLGDLCDWYVDDELVEEFEEARVSGIAFYGVETV